jgi:Zn-dependent protease with chaperone function
VPGLSDLVRRALETVGDRSTRIALMSDTIHCGDEQFPELVVLMDRARRRLDLPFRPSVYLGESPHMNAMTTGVKDPVIVVRSALLDQMSDAELVAVLGHELGHLHAEHPLYHSVARILLQGGTSASHLIALLSLPIQRLVLRWTRCAELTADRAALLASRDLEACIGVMLTFAGGNRPGITGRTQMRLAPFIRQCRELARMQTHHSFDRVLSNLLSIDRTHPNVAWRVMHLIHWIEHGNYLEILAGSYLRRAPSSSQRTLEVLP